MVNTKVSCGLICSNQQFAYFKFPIFGMRKQFDPFLFLLFGTFLFPKITFAQTAEKPNIIFIMFDDLNDWVEPFGGHPQVETPNLNAISSLGTTFLNAYCSAPVCAPSRTSLLLGKNPTYTGVYNNEEFNEFDFRSNFPPEKYLITLPEYLKDNGGYYTITFNKIFHADQNFNDYDDITLDNCAKTLSWNEDIYTGNNGGIINVGESLDEDVGKFEWAQIDDSLTTDMQDFTITDKAATFLNDYATNPSDFCDKPFFLALGYHKPHLELFIPEQYFLPFYISDFFQTPYQIPYNDPKETFPYNGVVLPPQPVIPYSDYDSLNFVGKSLSNVAVHNDFETWADSISLILSISDTLDTEQSANVLMKSKLANATMAYLAAVKFVDEQLGRFWDALNTHPELLNNSVIIISSDHGFALDEKKHWKKNALWETDIRIPFIIIDMRNPIQKTCTINVSLLDLFPTICDLTLNAYPLFPDSSKYLEGKSLVSILNDSTLHYESPVLTTYMAEDGKQVSCNEQYSVRNERFHYIQYHSNNVQGNLTCDSLNSVLLEELYEIGTFRETDPNEWNNLIGNPDFIPVVEYLSQWIPGHPLYTKTTFNLDPHFDQTSCQLILEDSIFLSFEIYDTAGLKISPPEEYLYYWTNNITDDTIFSTETYFAFNDIQVFNTSKRVIFYVHMLDTNTHVIVGFDLIYAYLFDQELPEISFDVNTTYQSNSVSVYNVSVEGEYDSIWWDFGDGNYFYGQYPGEHIYNEYGIFTITCYVSFGNYDTCIIELSREVEIVSFNYAAEENLLIFPDPSYGLINVATKELVQEGEILITDVAGKLLNQFILHQNGLLIHAIDLSNLPQGLYFITLKSPTFTSSKPFIII